MDSDNEHENRWMADKETDRWLSGADPGRANCPSSRNAMARRSSCAAGAECAFECERRKSEPKAGTGSRLWIPRSLTQRCPMRRKLHNRPAPARTDKTEVRSPGQDQQQNGAAPPVGTAAAPGEQATGVTASKPAGAAIAPAKQRRVRTFLISLGVVAAAGVAIGIVAGLSRTSPSQPK